MTDQWRQVDDYIIHFIQMEFPQLGQHCSAKTCNKLGRFSLLIHKKFSFISLDFLPMKCDACSAIFW